MVHGWATARGADLYVASNDRRVRAVDRRVLQGATREADTMRRLGIIIRVDEPILY